jgi:hypothetical protein
MTKILTVLNLIGSAAAFAYLLWCMRSTTRDNAHPVLVRFEWAFLAMLGLTCLHQVRILVGDSLHVNIPSGFSHLTAWVSAFFFSRYLRMNFK